MAGYVKNKGRSNTERHVQLPYYLINSLAYKSLSYKSIAAYIEIKKRYNSYNNGEIHVSVRSLSQVLGCSSNTSSKALNELQDRGFIICRFKGKFDHKVHQASEFILTEYKYDNKRETKNFMKWKPDK